MPALGPSIRAEAPTLALAFAAGAIAGWGRPGVDRVLLSVLGLVVMFLLAIRAESPYRALARGVAFGAGECGVALLGTLSWGAVVPLTFSLVIIAARHAPLAIFGHWAFRTLTPGRASIGIFALAVIAQVLGDALGLSQKLAAPLAASVPGLVGGARLVGADSVGGILAAACFWSACGVHASLSRGLWVALRAGLIPLAAGAASLGGLSLLGRISAPEATSEIAVGVPQINAASSYYQSRLISPDSRRSFVARFEDQLRALDAAELVVMTETYDGGFGLMFPRVRAAWQDYTRQRRQAVFVTSYLAEANGKKSNAVGAFDADGTFVGFHRKVQLAPFGEAVLTPGTEFRTFPVLGGVRVGVLICLESYLAQGPLALVRAGANLLVATTSDVTFGTTATPFEHLAGTQLRAVEVGRSVIWASNAGPSGVIDRWGKTSLGPFREAGAVRGVAKTYAGLTPYARFRALWIGLAVLLFGGVVVIRMREQNPIPAALAAAPARSLASPRLAAVAGLVGGTAAIALSPALVELRHGRASRVAQALTESLQPSTLLTQAADPYAPFRVPQARSADGAVAYLLTYYGLDATAGSMSSDPAGRATLADTARFVEQGHGLALRPLDLTRESAPMLAWLAELHDGTVVVADYDGGDEVRVFVSHWKRLAVLPPSRMTELLRAKGFVPVWRPANSGTGVVRD